MARRNGSDLVLRGLRQRYPAWEIKRTEDGWRARKGGYTVETKTADALTRSIKERETGRGVTGEPRSHQ